jgi:hypothetical protein
MYKYLQESQFDLASMAGQASFTLLSFISNVCKFLYVLMRPAGQGPGHNKGKKYQIRRAYYDFSAHLMGDGVVIPRRGFQRT